MRRMTLLGYSALVALLLSLVFPITTLGDSGHHHSVHLDEEAAPNWRFTQDAYGSKKVRIIGSNRTLVIDDQTTSITVEPHVLSSALGTGGEVYFITRDFSLKARSASGETRTLLPANSANGPLLINRKDKKLAYTKPDGQWIPDTNRLAVLDLASEVETVLAAVPGRTIHPLAWDDDALLVEMPPYRPTLDIVSIALDGTITPIPSLTGVIPKTGKATYPMVSFDGAMIAYPTEDGVWMINVASKHPVLRHRERFGSWDPSDNPA